MSNKTEITVFDTKVRVLKIDDQDYFCLTDLAKYKNPKRPDLPIQSWINGRPNLSAIHEWEILYNKDFKHSTDRVFKGFKEYLAEAFLKNTGSPSKWISYTNAKGFLVKRGKYGGTYAHSTLALHFANYINPKFYIHVLEEYQTLKKERFSLLGDPFGNKRNLAAGNYSLLMASIFSQVDERLLSHPQPYKSRLPFASEVDMINKIVFGYTAKEWRLQNTDKPTNRNQRDYASVLDLVVLNNLEFLDAMLLQWDCEKEERKNLLQQAYDFQYPILKRSKTIKRMQELADKLIE